MTEQEIIKYLKENRTKRVAFGFMPEEVKEWCKEHMYEPIFNVYFYNGWCKRKSEICCFYPDVYTLIDNYGPKSEFIPIKRKIL